MKHSYTSVDVMAEYRRGRSYVDRDYNQLRLVGAKGFEAVIATRSRLLPVMAVLYVMTHRAAEHVLGRQLEIERGKGTPDERRRHYEIDRISALYDLVATLVPMSDLVEQLHEEVWTVALQLSEWTPEPGRFERIEDGTDVVAWARYESGGTLHGLLALMRNTGIDMADSRKELDECYAGAWSVLVTEATQAVNRLLLERDPKAA